MNRLYPNCVGVGGPMAGKIQPAGTIDYRALLVDIVESSDDAFIGKSLEGYVAFWNRGAERIYGYSAEEAVGRHIGFLAPDDRSDEIPALIESVKRGETVAHFETRRLAKDGRLLDISLSLVPIRDGHGVLTGISAIARDCTALRSAESRLRELAVEAGQHVANCVAALTPRERELLSHLMRGLSNKAIALELRISPRTVELHRGHLMRKMAARNLSDLIRMMSLAGLAGY